MRPFPEPQPRIAFLLGKPLRPAAVIAEVHDRLEALFDAVPVCVPSGDAPLPAWLFDSTLVVQRGLGLPALTAALRLERAGIRCCNRIAATILVKDRALTVQTLADAGVPVPATASAATWSELLDLAAGRPVVAKAAVASVGRGLGVLIAATGDLPAQAPFAGPYIAQEYVPGDERDYKVYVAGRQARGVVKKPPPRQPADERGVPFAVDAVLTELAHLAGGVLDLEIFSVDFLYGPNGPVIVDVNAFTGFRGVPRAAPLIAGYLTAVATGQDQD
jgi:ribosomal protein S6--L-glutamate ligase